MAFSFPTISYAKHHFRPTIRKLSNTFRNAILHKRLTVLSVSLLNGRFKAMSIINNSVHQTWEMPGYILRYEALRQAISDAIHHTQFPGTHISILVEDQRFINLTLQPPVMPLADLLPILERKAQQAKTWEGPAAWRYQLGIQARGKQSVHLEIWPQRFIDDIIQICEDSGLHLQQLAPLSALSESQISTLSVEPGEASILISMLEGKVMFVAGGEDGTPILTRHLAPAQDWVPLGERVGTEVNRTIMFIMQQTNLNIPHIWFIGEEERLTLEEVQPHVSTTIFPCPITPDWKYWLWVGATLPIDLKNNFTPTEVRRAPLRKMFIKTLAATIAGFLIVGVGATGILEGYFAKNQIHLQTATAQAMALQEDHQQWLSRLVTIHTKRQWAQSITETKAASLEGPLLSYLGNVIPPQMILHKTAVKHTGDIWDLELSGRTSANLPSALLLVDQLARQLAQGPYHVTVKEGWRDQLLSQTNSQALGGATQPHYQWTLKGNFS
jgi:hypothetical protein